MSRRKPLSWEVALSRYETHLKARNVATRTRIDYLRALDHLRDTVDLAPAKIEVSDLRSYQCDLLTGVASRSGRALSPGTVAAKAAAWGSFFGYLVEEGLLPADPTVRLERPRLSKGAPKAALSTAETKRLLQATSHRRGALGLRDRAVIEVLYSTGLRRNELIDLDLSDLDREEREVIVRAGKGGKGRRNPLTRCAYNALTAYLQLARADLDRGLSQALFLNAQGGRVGRMYLADLCRDLAKKAGIKKRVTPHTLRRTFATHLLRGGASLRHIQLLLGHARLDTTAQYLQVDSEGIRRELLKKHPREQFEV